MIVYPDPHLLGLENGDVVVLHVPEDAPAPEANAWAGGWLEWMHGHGLSDVLTVMVPPQFDLERLPAGEMAQAGWFRLPDMPPEARDLLLRGCRFVHEAHNLFRLQPTGTDP